MLYTANPLVDRDAYSFPPSLESLTEQLQSAANIQKMLKNAFQIGRILPQMDNNFCLQKNDIRDCAGQAKSIFHHVTIQGAYNAKTTSI